eukprot:CAMPEP_0202727152 /NCGR_PEP_ID=MMETSP1385-20130828/184977_1 /ASSEMBLY_ACC=CAM_ASM_000861 /TAXON_ID=933848 /ORGANISM="Elphidium margaritaceum" /LENGTH=804 /DNA_ID=CAMNT_0049393391 /DNA_START=33 /DNA_END=2447 /DNA_ORIENTATION=-
MIMMSQTKKLVAILLLTLWLFSLSLAQNNQYTTSVGANGEFIWQSTSDFIPGKPGQAYGTIPIGDEMTMEFDWTWHGRTVAGEWQQFFRVGLDPTVSAGCDGAGSRYPSFWLPGTADEMHVSVSSGILCQKGQRFADFGTISVDTEYHVQIAFDSTSVTIKASESQDWPNNNVKTQTFTRDATLPEYVGETASVWWISEGFDDGSRTYAGDATFRNVVLTSIVYANLSTTSTSSPTVTPTESTSTPTLSPTLSTPAPTTTTTSDSTSTPTTIAPTTTTSSSSSSSTASTTVAAPTTSTSSTTSTQLIVTTKSSTTPAPTEREGQVEDMTTTPSTTLDDDNLNDDIPEEDGDTLMYIIIVCGVVGCCICCGLFIFFKRRSKPQHMSSETPGYTEQEFEFRFQDGSQKQQQQQAMHGQILDDEPDTDDQVMANLNTHQQMHHHQAPQHMNYAPMQNGFNGYHQHHHSVNYSSATDVPPPPPPMMAPRMPSQPSGIQIVTHANFGAMHGNRDEQKQARGGELGSPYTPMTPDGEINPQHHQFLSEAQREHAGVTRGGDNGRASIATIDDIPNEPQAAAAAPHVQMHQGPAPVVPQRNVNEVVNALQNESQPPKVTRFLSLRHQQPQQEEDAPDPTPHFSVSKPSERTMDSFGYQHAPVAMTDDEDDLIVGDMITQGYIGDQQQPQQPPQQQQQQQQGIQLQQMVARDRPLPPAPAQPDIDGVHITYGDDDASEDDDDEADNAIEQKLTIGAMDDDEEEEEDLNHSGLLQKQLHHRHKKYGALRTNDQDDDDEEDEDDIYAPADATEQ